MADAVLPAAFNFVEGFAVLGLKPVSKFLVLGSNVLFIATRNLETQKLET